MIQIYKANNSNFDYNGDAILHPISCELKMELNGTWIMNLKNPIDQNFELIGENAVIKCATPVGDNQLFRIYHFYKSDEFVEASAYPIFIDAKDDAFLFDVRPTSKNGQDALNLMMKGTKYKGSSDIIKLNTAYYIRKNLIEAIASDDENSFLNRWGGEVSYNNYNVTINQSIGGDNGARAEFGYNLTGIREDVDMSSVVTRIVPQAFNGYTLPNSETVDSPIIGAYPKIFIKNIKYEDVKLAVDVQGDEAGFSSLSELYAELRKRAKAEYTNGIDKPTVNYQVSIIDLSRTDEYKNFKHLVELNLGDTVYCKNRRLNIETVSRVISLDYDCVLKKVMHLELGQFSKNFFNDISSTNSAVKEVIDTENKSLLADKIVGIMNAGKAQMRYQKDIAQKQDVRAILFEDLDRNSPTFGACCFGSLGFQISNKRNTTDTDWTWSTVGNANGFIADAITAGVLRAIKIEGVEISNGLNFFVDAKGNLQCTNAKISGHIDATSGTFSGDIVGGSISGETTINVGTDLHVGDNIYLGDQTTIKHKSISLSKDVYIALSEGVLKLMTRNNENEAYVHVDSGLYPKITLRASNGTSYSTFMLDRDSLMMTVGAGRLNIFGKSFTWYGNLSVNEWLSVSGKLTVTGDFLATGTKSRLVETETHGKRLLNAVESANCYFTDEGQVILSEDGQATIFFDPIWMETVNTKERYHIQLTPYCEVSPWIVEEYQDRFVIAGKPNTKVNWNVSALQFGYEHTRLEEYKKEGDEL